MQKLRLRYAKRGRLRFTSHRDIARAFERSLRRAGVPMAYSQGFSPHPKVSWVGAAPTGVASEAEYVEVQVVRRVDPDTLRHALDAALPAGLDVLEAVEAGPGTLAERIDASRWRIELPLVPAGRLRAAVRALLAAETVPVQRLAKDGRKTLDVRPAIVAAEVLEEELDTSSTSVTLLTRSAMSSEASTTGEVDNLPQRRKDDSSATSSRCGILMVVVRQLTPAVRPDDVLSALGVVADLEPPVPAMAIRMEQGRLDDGSRLIDPFALDRRLIDRAPVGESDGADGAEVARR
ncbi:MAG: DUF2344 domain-containing protein [Kutzneria sp.]|nr:DUF2344 domain-containing protein [Kutzneria sp.]MBV9847592.1 DUF2344 domain-containing protein [Kutzneria sp.]